jgi:coatomer protein complex subunit alpha (xenin)
VTSPFLSYRSAPNLSVQIVEKAYQQTKNFDRLSFLYLATGSTEKLTKMQKIAEARGDPMSRFHNALFTDDIPARIAVLRDVGLCECSPPAPY